MYGSKGYFLIFYGCVKVPAYMVPLYKQAKSDKQFQKGLHMAYRGASSESSQLLPDVDTVRQRVCSIDMIKFLKKLSFNIHHTHL